jgi:hypothetical protein
MPRHHEHHLPPGIDPELAAILPVIAGPGGDFGHREHIHLAFWAVQRYGMPAAAGTISIWLRQLTEYQRMPQKYNDTVSRAWMELVAYHVAADPVLTDFDAFASRYPALLDKRLLIRHYRSTTLASTQARQGWVEPDLIPFPWLANA